MELAAIEDAFNTGLVKKTDVQMPKMGGRELAEKATPLQPEMMVIFMSGYTNDTVIAEGIKVKGTKFLQKPFTAAELVHKVRDVLDGNRKTGTRGHSAS